MAKLSKNNWTRGSKRNVRYRNNYIDEQCQQIERFHNIHPKESHQMIKAAPGTHRGNHSGSVLKDESGKMLIEDSEILQRWERYIAELYDDPTRDSTTMNFSGNLTGYKVRSEIEMALKTMKTGNAAGEDGITVELYRKLGDGSIDFLISLTNKIYAKGEIPEEFRRSVFIALPKKPRAQECQFFRKIRLMNHATKVIQKVLYNRMKKTIRSKINDCQFGFLQDRGTRNAIVTLRCIAERCLEVNQNLYCCFIDYTKAFYRVQHNILMEIFCDLDMSDKDLRLVQNMYFNQSASIKHNGKVSGQVPIKRGVRQGDSPSSDYFSLYSEMIMREIDGKEGAKINGINVDLRTTLS